MRMFSGLILLISAAMIIIPQAVFPDDEILLPEEESSGSFVDADKDSSEVQLFLSGSWKLNISASTGFGWNPADGINTALSYSGISNGFAFSQSPDFTASMLILDRFLFEAAFTDDFDDSTFMLGYRGSEDELLRSVSLGNMGIYMSDSVRMSDYFYIPGGGPSSFGLHTALSGSFSSHELLFRFDPEEEAKKTYIGNDTVLELELNVQDYLKGRLFYVPEIPQDAIFYFEDSSSAAAVTTVDGRNFTAADAVDYSYSTNSGLLFLDKKTPGAILVRSASTDWALEGLGSETVSTSTGLMLVLYEPGIFSDFESAAAYNLNTVLPDDTSKTRIFLAADAESTSAGIDLTAGFIPADGIVILSPSAGGSKKYPLSGIIPDADRVYGAESIPSAGVISDKLIFQIREESSSYTVDNPVPGSIRIYINGIESFGWNENGGSIVFDLPPGDDDRIEIVYRKESGGTTGGDLLFASANSFYPAAGWTADLNAAIRWNIGGDYSLPGEQTSSYGGLSTGIRFDSTEKYGGDGLQLKAGLSAGVKLLSENSSGILLLKDMSNGQYNIPLNRNNVFPAGLSAALSVSDGITSADRGILYYKDYRISTGLSSYFLQDYDAAGIESSMIFSPEDSPAADKYKAGPYTAAALKDGRSGEILVMDYSLPASTSWTGIQIPLSSTTLDLSASNAISFDCRAEGDLSGIGLHLEIGSLTEDLDGDGVLDAEINEYSSGFIFNDPNSSAGTLVGGDNLTGSNGIADSEDKNGNGFLDFEKQDAAVIFSNITKPGADWQRVTYFFTDEAEKLKNAEFVRITAVNTSAAAQSGRIMFDNFRIEGASMFASDETGYKLPVYSETSESLLSTADKPLNPLNAPSVESGSENTVLRVNWSSPSSSPWELYSYISPVPADEYGSIVFYLHCPDVTASGADPAFLLFSLLDSGGKGIKASVPLDKTADWQKIEINTGLGGASSSVYINGIENSSAAVIADADAGDLYRIELAAEGTASGTLLLDEIYLENPSIHVVSGLSANLQLSVPDPLITAGEIEIIGPLNIVSAASADLNTDTYASVKEGSFTAGTALNTSMLTAPLSADISWKSEGTGILAAGHELEIPLFSGLLSITDSFRTDSVSGGGFYKGNLISLESSMFSGRLAGFTASLDSNQLVRKWFSELNTIIKPFSLGLSAELLLTDLDHSFGWSNYFTGWYEAVSLAGNFTAAGLKQRKTSFKLSPAFTTEPLGLNSELMLTADINASGAETDSAELRLKLPLLIELEMDSISADFTYSRRGSFGSESSATGFGEDIGRLFSTIGSRPYLYNSIPFYELFNPALPQTVFDDCISAEINTAAFSNAFRMSMSRNYSSRLLDLFLPYSVECGLERETIKDYSDSEDSLMLDFIWRSAALNLFGSAGVYPFFSFYFSDELNWSVETIVSAPFTPDAVQKYLINTGASVFGHRDDIFSIDASIFIPVNDEDSSSTVKTGLMYVWNQYPEKNFDLPLFTAEDEAFQLITHEEKLSLNFEDSFSTELRHTSSLILPQRFTLSAFGLAGFEYDSLSGNKNGLFGFSFGISGSVLY